jgi:hypothetical protein
MTGSLETDVDVKDKRMIVRMIFIFYRDGPGYEKVYLESIRDPVKLAFFHPRVKRFSCRGQAYRNNIHFCLRITDY